MAALRGRAPAETDWNLRPTIRLTISSMLVSPIRRSAVLRPSYSTIMRSQTTNRSCSRCVMRMTLTPRALTVLMSSSTASTSATASAAVGSSMIRTSGSNDTARPIAMLWRWPPERFSTFNRVLGMRMPRCVSIRAASACILRLVHQRHAEDAACAVRGRASGFPRRRPCRRATSPGRPSRRARAARRRARRSAPLGRRGVCDRSSGTSAPDSILLSVDLPAPLSPTRPRTSPARRIEIDAIQRLDRAERLADVLHAAPGSARRRVSIGWLPCKRATGAARRFAPTRLDPPT